MTCNDGKPEQTKVYTRPTLEKRAMLAEIAEGTPPVVPISGVIAV